MNKDTFNLIKMFPLQANIEDIEWLCEEIERLRDKRESLTEIIHRLEGMSANTDTDARWRAAAILREYQESIK